MKTYLEVIKQNIRKFLMNSLKVEIRKIDGKYIKDINNPLKVEDIIKFPYTTLLTTKLVMDDYGVINFSDEDFSIYENTSEEEEIIYPIVKSIKTEELFLLKSHKHIIRLTPKSTLNII